MYFQALTPPQTAFGDCMDKLYNIAFMGEVAEGFDVGEVRASFSERFQQADEVIDQLFSGEAITLAKDLRWEQASTAAANLRSLGAMVYVLDESGNLVEIPERRTANDAAEVVVEPVVERRDSAPDKEDPQEPTIAKEEPQESAPEKSENTDPYDLTATAKVRHLTQITDKRVIETPPVTDVQLPSSTFGQYSRASSR